MNKESRSVATDRAPSAQELSAEIANACSALRSVLKRKSNDPFTNADSDHPAGDRQSSLGSSDLDLAELRRAFEAIHAVAMPASPDGEVSTEIAAQLAEYRNLLRQFKLLLPNLYEQLLLERARLATRQSHSAAILGWIRTTRETR